MIFDRAIEVGRAKDPILETQVLIDCQEYPVICMNEKLYQLLGETREAIRMKIGKPRRCRILSLRQCSIFIFAEPLKGWRYTQAKERRTKIDWALQIRHLLEVEYPDCKKARIVTDNLNTHNISSLYEAFSPQAARRLARRLEIQYAPRH